MVSQELDDCRKGVESGIKFVERKIISFISDPDRQYSWVRAGALALMGFACPTSWTIVTGFVCIGATGVYVGAVAGSVETIRERYCAGEIDKEEAYARNAVGLTPIPFPLSVPVKAFLKERIKNSSLPNYPAINCSTREQAALALRDSAFALSGLALSDKE